MTTVPATVGGRGGGPAEAPHQNLLNPNPHPANPHPGVFPAITRPPISIRNIPTNQTGPAQQTINSNPYNTGVQYATNNSGGGYNGTLRNELKDNSGDDSTAATTDAGASQRTSAPKEGITIMGMKPFPFFGIIAGIAALSVVIYKFSKRKKK